ncbi:MAG: hypothetical protein RSD62_01095 [Ruthenibacterium sp.]
MTTPSPTSVDEIEMIAVLFHDENGNIPCIQPHAAKKMHRVSSYFIQWRQQHAAVALRFLKMQKQ